MVGKYEIEKFNGSDFTLWKFNGSDFTLWNEKKSNEKKAEKVAANLCMLMGNTHQVGESSVASISLGEESTMLWHRNLGHMLEQGLQILSDQKLLPGLNSVYLQFCEHCVTTKQHRFKFSTSEEAEADADVDHEELRTASVGMTSGNGEGWPEGVFLEVEAQFWVLGALRAGPRSRATTELLDNSRTVMGFVGIGEYGHGWALAEKLKLCCVERFKEGELGLEQLALVDCINELLTNSLVRAVCQINLSIFKSLPDWWAIGQMFPLMPIQLLNERPTVRAVLSDLTCNSDGIGRILATRFPRACLAVFCGGVVFWQVGGRARPSGPPLVPPLLAEGQKKKVSLSVTAKHKQQ